MARFTGTAGNDVINGTAYRDVIDGGTGNDTMIGGLEDDTYYVDSILDVITENAGEGTDWVYTTVSYAADDNVEHVRTIGNGNINLTGNGWDNTLIGTRGNNVLNGGGGADVMIGGAGNDTYFLNQFSLDGINSQKGVFDVIIDSGGIDTAVCVFNSPLFTELTYILQKDLDNVNFTGSETTMTVTGNRLKNIITTGDLEDTIDGGKGADTMDGGDGQNTFFIDNRLDVIIDAFDDFDIDAEPTDSADTAIIQATYAFDAAINIEFITFAEKGARQVTGSDSKNIITGNAFANIIYGAGGNDTIMGGGGVDVLYGGTGADTFKFESDVFDVDRPSPVKIMDFSLAQGDILDISDIISYEDGTIISAYIEITDRGRDSIVRVNINETASPSTWVHVATIVGVNGLTGESALFDNGNLILETST